MSPAVRDLCLRIKQASTNFHTHTAGLIEGTGCGPARLNQHTSRFKFFGADRLRRDSLGETNCALLCRASELHAALLTNTGLPPRTDNIIVLGPKACRCPSMSGRQECDYHFTALTQCVPTLMHSICDVARWVSGCKGSSRRQAEGSFACCCICRRPGQQDTPRVAIFAALSLQRTSVPVAMASAARAAKDTRYDVIAMPISRFAFGVCGLLTYSESKRKCSVCYQATF